MMESNTFRLYMMIGGIVVGALLIGLVFLAPVKDVPKDTRVMVERVMEKDFPSDRLYTSGPYAQGVSLTTYEMMTFYIKGSIRGNTRHY